MSGGFQSATVVDAVTTGAGVAAVPAEAGFTIGVIEQTAARARAGTAALESFTHVQNVHIRFEPERTA